MHNIERCDDRQGSERDAESVAMVGGAGTLYPRTLQPLPHRFCTTCSHESCQNPAGRRNLSRR